MIAAGYIIYGSGTVFVLASAFGVHGFTLDPSVGEFFLSHPDIRIPKAGIYSCNEAYSPQWQPGVNTFIDSCKADGYRARYIGSLVADFHRNLIKGGVFLYPATAKAPAGKLRLLYEAFPLAYLVEAAGGAATDGVQPILDKVAQSLHDRTPLIIGSAAAVDKATQSVSSDTPFAT